MKMLRPDLFNDAFADRSTTGRSQCTVPGCGCIAYVSDLTNRRICTCDHAAVNHEFDEWASSASPAVAGTRRNKCAAPGCGCIAYVSDLTNRRICTCTHAAADHESDEWASSASRAAAGQFGAINMVSHGGTRWLRFR
jgi:hypothetical protein